MEAGVSYDNLGDMLDALGQPRPAIDGSLWLPRGGTVTLTSSKYVDGASQLVVRAALDGYSWSWRSPDLFVIETAKTEFFVPRDEVGEVLDVDLPEQPHARTVSIEFVPELTLDVTFEYEPERSRSFVHASILRVLGSRTLCQP